eukprot:TRINITY_DN7246_c0_g3_i1.p1 TRINITY_DN7246_c0_g3~~TRINITY_DN7246_c0_g3_i1.p1  ORF type:complete len:531 (+),score=65.94 TRINITY_DN7246_c0_g3_i1:143-1594(+)
MSNYFDSNVYGNAAASSLTNGLVKFYNAISSNFTNNVLVNNVYSDSILYFYRFSLNGGNTINVFTSNVAHNYFYNNTSPWGIMAVVENISPMTSTYNNTVINNIGRPLLALGWMDYNTWKTNTVVPPFCQYTCYNNTLQNNSRWTSSQTTAIQAKGTCVQMSRNTFDNPAYTFEIEHTETYIYYQSPYAATVASYNYWGTTNVTYILGRIYGGSRYNRGLIDVSPILRAPSDFDDVINDPAVGLSGSLMSNTFWDSSMSPIFVSNNIFIPAEYYLDIGPNVTIYMHPGARFVVAGALITHGTPESPVIITSVNELKGTAAAGDWGVIAFLTGLTRPILSTNFTYDWVNDIASYTTIGHERARATNTSYLAYTTIRYGGYGNSDMVSFGQDTGAIMIGVRITDTKAKGIAGIFYVLQIFHSYFARTTTDALYMKMQMLNRDLVVYNNTFVDCYSGYKYELRRSLCGSISRMTLQETYGHPRYRS